MEDYRKEALNFAHSAIFGIERSMDDGGTPSRRQIIELVAAISVLGENELNQIEIEHISRACEALKTTEKRAEQRFKSIQQITQKALSDISAKTGFKYTPTQDCANDSATIQQERNKLHALHHHARP